MTRGVKPPPPPTLPEFPLPVSVAQVGLNPATSYVYTIGTNATAGTQFSSSFTSKNESIHAGPTLAVFGDMGTVIPGGGESLSLPRIIKDVESGNIDGVLHVGDFA